MFCETPGILELEWSNKKRFSNNVVFLYDWTDKKKNIDDRKEEDDRLLSTFDSDQQKTKWKESNRVDR